MRILYVLPSLLIGGAEALVSQWASLLHQAGHTVEVCTLYTDGPIARRLRNQNIRIHNLNHDVGIEHYRMRRKYDPRLIFPLAQVIRQGNYQIAHAHLFPSLLYLAFVSYLQPNTTYLYSEHSVQNRRRNHVAWKVMDRFLYSRYRQIIPVSERVQASLIQWLPELSQKVQVIPNTVNGDMFGFAPGEIDTLRKELGIVAEEWVVLFAGRLVPEKGADILVEAAARLAHHFLIPVRVIIAGEGPLRVELEGRSRSLPLPVRVTFLGNREDLPQLLGLADLVVLPSRWEGLPMVLLEAMAAGKAILATPVGGIPEAIQHKVSGWLVPAEDPTALADGLAYLLPQKALRARLGKKACQEFEEKYSPQSAIEQLLQIYSRYDRA